MPTSRVSSISALALLASGCLATGEADPPARYEVTLERSPSVLIDPRGPEPTPDVEQLPPAGQAPRVVSSGLPVASLQVSGGMALWTTISVGDKPAEMRALDLQTGTLLTVRALGGEGQPVVAAATEHAVYFTDHGTSEVVAVDRATGELTVIAADQAGPWGLTVSDDWVYWTNLDDGSIARARHDGAAASLIARDAGVPGIVGLVDDTLFWVDPAAGTVQSMPADGGRARTVATGQAVTSPLLAADRHLFWTDANGHAVMSARADGKRSEVLTRGQLDPVGLAVHDGWVYFATQADGALLRARFPGGAVDQILAGVRPATHVAFTGAEVLWSDDNGTIFAYAP